MRSQRGEFHSDLSHETFLFNDAKQLVICVSMQLCSACVWNSMCLAIFPCMVSKSRSFSLTPVYGYVYLCGKLHIFFTYVCECLLLPLYISLCLCVKINIIIDSFVWCGHDVHTCCFHIYLCMVW